MGVLKSVSDYFLHNDCGFCRLVRFGGRSGKKYAADGLRGSLFTIKTAILLAVTAGIYLIGNTAWNGEGYQLSFPVERVALDEVTGEGEVSLIEDGVVKTYLQTGSIWFGSDEDGTFQVQDSEKVEFLNSCLAYNMLRSRNGDLPKPSYESKGWFPDGVAFVE